MLVRTFLAILASMLVDIAPAFAASRTWCLCQGQESGPLHHRFACEIHFKKPGKWPATGAPSKGGCTVQESAQFKTYLCVSRGCTYEYIRASDSKVPLGK